MAHRLNVSTHVRCRQADGLPDVSASVTSGSPFRGPDMLTPGPDLPCDSVALVDKAVVSSAARMRRLRERRQSNTRVVSVEVTAADGAYLRARGFLREGETTREYLALALQRLLQSIR